MNNEIFNDKDQSELDDLVWDIITQLEDFKKKYEIKYRNVSGLKKEYL